MISVKARVMWLEVRSRCPYCGRCNHHRIAKEKKVTCHLCAGEYSVEISNKKKRKEKAASVLTRETQELIRRIEQCTESLRKSREALERNAG